MSEHIHGHMAQTLVHDFGDFEDVMGLRVRKEMVLAYTLAGPIKQDEPDHEFHGKYSVNVMMSSGWNATRPATKEECEREIARLDWIFKKEKKSE